VVKKKVIKKKATKKTENNTDWHAFVTWCQERGLTAIPANPWTLSAYAHWVEPQLSHKDIVSAFKTIFRVHATKSRRRPDRDPLVISTLEKIAERAKEKKAPKDKAAPLFPDDDILKPGSPKKTKKTALKATPGKTGKRKVLPGLSASPKLVKKRKLKK